MGRTGQRLVSDSAQAAAAVAEALRAIDPGACVVLAVSGGPDSTAMAALVSQARPDLVATAVHVRHGLRDDAADAAAAAEVARHLGLNFEQRSVDVFAADGVEADARRARYDALATAGAQRGASWVLVGHTADDQAETVLLNIARGAGLAGASGMAAARDLGGARLLRPMLRIRRDAARAAAADLVGAIAVSDPMNDDDTRRRTRARTELLPALARLSGGATDPVTALVRLADAAADDDAALTAIADDLTAREVRHWGPVTALRWDALVAAPRAVAARVVRRLATGAGSALGTTSAPGATTAWPSAVATARVLALEPGRSVPLAGGLVAARGNGWLTVAPRASAPSFAGSLAVGIGACVGVPTLGVVVERAAEPLPGTLPFWARDDSVAVVPAPGGVLTARPVRRNDQIHTWPRRHVAAAVRATVPNAARPYVLVLVDDDGPLWVPGVAVRAGLRDVGAGFIRLTPSAQC